MPDQSPDPDAAPHARAPLSSEAEDIDAARLRFTAGPSWSIAGDCDSGNAQQVEHYLVAIVDTAAVDMSAVTFFDAASLRVWLSALARNPGLRMLRPSPQVNRVLDITGTSQQLVTDAN